MHMFGAGCCLIDDPKTIRQLNKAKKLLKEAMEHLDYENNQKESIELKYEIERFLKGGKKK